MEKKDQDKGDTTHDSLSTFRNTKVKALEKSNNELIQRVKQLEQVCVQLQGEIIKLRAILENNSDNINSGIEKPTPNQNDMVFETDEEELVTETDWILQKNKKKQTAVNES